MKLCCKWVFLFYALHQTNSITFSMIDAVNKYSADIHTVFCFIPKYDGCSHNIFSDHCLIQMPLLSHLFMPFHRIISGRTVTFCSADIYVCFKCSDRHVYNSFQLVFFSCNNIHSTSSNVLQIPIYRNQLAETNKLKNTHKVSGKLSINGCRHCRQIPIILNGNKIRCAQLAFCVVICYNRNEKQERM